MSSPPRVIRQPRPQSAQRSGDRPQSAQADEDSRGSSARISLGRVFRAEGSNYFLLLGTALFLVVFGLVMVLSSSSVDSLVGDQGSFGGFLRQGIFAIVGIPLMLIVSRFPIAFWKRFAFPMLAISSFLQFLVVVTPLGITVGGNTNWLAIGPVQFQPSEGIKVALVIWLGLIVSRKQDVLDDWRRGFLPILLIGGAAIGLVLLGGDLGTVMIMAAILIGAMFFAGIRLRMLAVPLVGGAAVFGVVAIASPNRLQRITAFLGDTCDDYVNSCWQTQHGNYALANGGIFGVGLGGSKAKWSWLPAADNDFIFAIIGEELGLIGAIVVLALFVLLAFAFIRIMRASDDMFARVTTAAVMVWVIGQACVNIGVVLGVFPVLGVPLPLISAGGTALLTTLLAIGVVLSFARTAQAEQRSDPSLGRSGRHPR
ncbi:putative lipid II flippase FtsW [Luethyella okanaganae]|uniref:Probable peptidoglycan glycosyltransferase FtsW n=1 Tax=Luethyella okanaganae TaxID=69372 RepID=A0ABW1VCP0_9MICO